MNPITIPTTTRPNRVLVALAAAWFVLSLAIGGVVNADSSDQPAATTSVSQTAER